jgi:DNA-binding NtrC family response regulator
MAKISSAPRHSSSKDPAEADVAVRAAMNVRRVVIIGKEAEIQQLARKVGREILVADDLAEALDTIETTEPDLILLEQRFDQAGIRQFIDKVKENSTAPVILVSNDQEGRGGHEEHRLMGCDDFLSGRQDHHRLKQIVCQMTDNKEINIDAPERTVGDFFATDYAAAVSMVGRSKALISTLRMIRLVASSRCNPVLILGETGTGKELAARAVHNLRHPSRQFVAVNCAALTANLLESELFGHEKGSFTGADREKTGLLEVADGGTLFLDEISEMPVDLQAKLLRVLQEMTFRKVGGIKDIACNATIMASSNRNLQKETQANRFRSDLYYRLNVSPIVIAPLRSPDRKEDIGLLAEYFLDTSTICPDKPNKITSLTKLALAALQEYDWPGNVRELRNVIERAILLETTDKIGLNNIVIDPSACGGASENQIAGGTKSFSLEKAERELISRALQETGWQKTRAAALLGITRATLYAKVKHYNIEKGSYIAKQTGTEEPGSSGPEHCAAAR